MKILEKLRLVKRRLCFHKLVIDVLQKRILAICKWVMDRSFNRIISIPAIAIHICHHMTNGTCDSGMSRRIINNVKIRVIKRTAKKRYRVVATGTPARCIYIAIPLKQNLTCLAYTCKIRRIVKRTEVMHTMKPAIMNIRVAFLTILIRPVGKYW